MGDFTVIDWGTVVGGLIAGLVGLLTTLIDRRLEKRRISQNWHRRVYRLSVRLQFYPTEKFFEISNLEQNRVVAQYNTISDRLDDELTKAPPKPNLELLAICENLIMNCRRMKLNQDSRSSQHRYHRQMLKRAEEVQYLAKTKFSESYHPDMDAEKVEEVESRLSQKDGETNK